MKVGDKVKDPKGNIGVIEHIGPAGLLARVKFSQFEWAVSLWLKDLTPTK